MDKALANNMAGSLDGTLTEILFKLYRHIVLYGHLAKIDIDEEQNLDEAVIKIRQVLIPNLLNDPEKQSKALGTIKPYPVMELLHTYLEGAGINFYETLPLLADELFISGILRAIGIDMGSPFCQQLSLLAETEIKKVLKPEGTCWLNLGDSYTGSRGMGSFVDSKAKKGMTIIKDYHRSGSVGNIQPKNLVGIPWRVAFALQTDGWFLRQDLIWSKPNPMPESVKDRCTKSHEYIFLLTKSPHYYYDYKAILEPAAYDGRADTYFKGSKKYKDSGQTFAKRGHERWPNKLQDQTGLHTHKYNPKLIGHTGDNHSGYFDEGGRPRATLNNDGIFARNKRSVWTVSTKPFKGAHFATFPPELITPMILAGCPKGGLILDPFMGAGTSALVAKYHNRNYTGIELNEKYIVLAEERLKQAFYPSNPLKCPF